MEKLILTNEENLISVALSVIGINLPQEFVLRVCKLQELAKEKGLKNIQLSDSVEIEHWANQEMAKRLKKYEEEK